MKKFVIKNEIVQKRTSTALFFRSLVQRIKNIRLRVRSKNALWLHIFEQPQRGFTLVEILTAVVIMVVGIFGVVSLFTQLTYVSSDIEQDTLVALLAEKKIEDVKVERVFEDVEGDFLDEGYERVQYSATFTDVDEIPGVLRLQLIINSLQHGKSKVDKFVTYVRK